MARIRLLEIKNFRGIKQLRWAPAEGINCLIGPGDSCKTSVLDAIDLCLGARRNVQITDADFHGLSVEEPLSISCTIGALADRLKNLETYGLYLRNYLPETQELEDEPASTGETVLTVNLTVDSDLEPFWSLVSERATDQGLSRNLSWADRQAIAPTRIGATVDGHLVWRRGSVLNKLSEEKADISAALVKAAREARASFGESAGMQLDTTLEAVKHTADELGIQVGDEVKAMLDAHSVSFSGGSISLHTDMGIPLHSLGVGSTRLLTAGLQRKASADSTMVLVDELEHGLEPHRIVRLLGSLGSKEGKPPLQVFATTHSPVALQELSGDQLMIARRKPGALNIKTIGTKDGVQSTLRSNPEAFLATSVIICEGASEVGLLRGIDHHRIGLGMPSLTALGVSLVDAGGVSKIYKRANAFIELGYRCHVLRDDDEQPDISDEAAFIASGGQVTMWPDNRNLEQEIFENLSDKAVGELVQYARELHGDDLVNDQLNSKSDGKMNLCLFDIESLTDDIQSSTRTFLGLASSNRRTGWFKSVSWMEEAGRRIIGPDLMEHETSLSIALNDLFKWMPDDR